MFQTRSNNPINWPIQKKEASVEFCGGPSLKWPFLWQKKILVGEIWPFRGWLGKRVFSGLFRQGEGWSSHERGGSWYVLLKPLFVECEMLRGVTTLHTLDILGCFCFVAVSVDRSAWCCLLATYHATPWDESSVTVVFEEVLSDVLGHGQVSSNMQLVLAGCRKPQGWLNYGKFDEWIEPHGCAFFVLKNVHPWQLGWNSPKSCTLQNKKYIQLCIS